MFIALFALAGCGGSKSTTSELPATRKAPTFTTVAANDFVKNLSQTANDFAAAIEAKDVKRIKTLSPKLGEILKKRHEVASGLKPSEAGRLQGWINVLMRQVKDTAMDAATPSLTNDLQNDQTAPRNK